MVQAIAPDGQRVDCELYVRGSTFQRLQPCEDVPGLHCPTPGMAEWRRDESTSSGWSLQTTPEGRAWARLSPTREAVINRQRSATALPLKLPPPAPPSDTKGILLAILHELRKLNDG